jgi:exopolyphosphatase/guanosine-5'-triphosphate,3'-diphosphate pyrophosphatase
MTTDPRAPVGAIDCGTNSTRLLIMDRRGVPLTRLMRITRLGRGVDGSRRLDPQAVEDTVGVLAEFRRSLERVGVDRVRMVATSAVRDAANGREFLAEAARVVGAPAELLSGEEEGALAYAGATIDLPAAVGDDVVVDIGGGSTELVLQRHGDLQVVSLDLGCVRLSERYLKSDPPLPGELGAAVDFIDAQLCQAVRTMPRLGSLRPGSRLIGLAGTVSTLAALEQGVGAYSRDRIHHFILFKDGIFRWANRLAAETASARLGLPGMVEGRQDVIVGGAMILRAVLTRLRFNECLVSESDILDGLAASILSTEGS